MSWHRNWSRRPAFGIHPSVKSLMNSEKSWNGILMASYCSTQVIFTALAGNTFHMARDRKIYMLGRLAIALFDSLRVATCKALSL